MNELLQLLTGAKPYQIPASAIRPMPFDDGIQYDESRIECSCCNRQDLTEKDFYVRKDGRLYRTCKTCCNDQRRRTRKMRNNKCD